MESELQNIYRTYNTAPLFYFLGGQGLTVCSSECPGTHSIDQVGLELRDPQVSASIDFSCWLWFFCFGFVFFCCFLGFFLFFVAQASFELMCWLLKYWAHRTDICHHTQPLMVLDVLSQMRGVCHIGATPLVSWE